MILEYDGVRIDNDSHLINLVNLTEIGREVPVSLFRDGRILKVVVRPGVNPSTRARAEATNK